MCRKTTGSAFSVAGAVDAGTFRLTSGQERIRRYESSPATHRCFCARCGATVPGAPFDGKVWVPFGNLADDPGGRPVAHIFVAWKAPWHEIADELMRFDAYPPGIPGPSRLPARPPRSGTPGSIGGSCLCGAVAFEYERPIEAWHNCHCSRCRRARGTAHASNVFVPLARFRWLDGADEVEAFKVPEAERFTQTFCRGCGAKVPRVNPQRGYVSIPAGSLDDDPVDRPERHIYVASKAPWHEIADALPRFAESPS
jgi:hypothetical protein